MKRFILFFVAILSLSTLAQNKNLQEIRASIKDVFKINVSEFDNKKYTYFFVDTLIAPHYLSNFIQDYRLVLDYLLQNQLSINNDSLNLVIDKKENLNNYFYRSIENDSAFCNNIVGLIARYLNAQGLPVKDYLYKESYEVSVDRIAAISARFFYPNKIIEGKGISMKLCVGALSFKDYEGERNFIEEAFAFLVVMSSGQSDNQDLVEEYKKEAKYVLNMKLSNKDDIKLNRVQGAVWALLSRNPKLIDHIKANYNNKKSALPFSIIF